MGTLLGVCLTLASAACADGLTGVDPLSIGAGPVQSASKLGSGGTVDVVCSTSYATPGGPYAYGYGRLTVKLSAASRAADGSTRQYRYRGYAEGQRVVLAANCTIPNTERAFRQMNQRFGVKEAHAGRRWSDGGGATTRSDYTLPPLTVNACRYGGDYPECNPPPPTSGTETDNPPCWNDYGCDSGGSPTGGDDPEPPAVEEAKQAKDGESCPSCGERAPSAEEDSVLNAQVQKIQCADVRSALTSMLAGGSIKVHTVDTGYYGEWNSYSQIIYISLPKHWRADGTVDEAELADTLAHEGVHKMLGHTNSTPTAEAHGQAFTDKMASCGYSQT